MFVLPYVDKMILEERQNDGRCLDIAGLKQRSSLTTAETSLGRLVRRIFFVCIICRAEFPSQFNALLQVGYNINKLLYDHWWPCTRN